MESWNHISWMWKKIFRSFTLQSQSVLKYLDLVLKMQNNSIAVSNLLCYDNEPRVNKKISFKLLGNMLTLFITVRSFSYAEEKHKIKSNKSKSQKPKFSSSFSVPTFVAFTFVFKNSLNSFSWGLPCSLMWSYFCGKYIPGETQDKK